MFASYQTPDQVAVVVVVDEVVVLVSVELELLDVEELLDDEESLEDEELLDDELLEDDELLDVDELLEDEESLDELLEEEELLDDELLEEEELELDGAVGVTVSLQPATSAAVNSASAATGASGFRRCRIMLDLLPARTLDGDHTVCRESVGTGSNALKSR